jgi:hypothetical protein
LLTHDAVSASDGGGKSPARATPIIGGLAVARFLRGLFKPTSAKRDILGGSPALYAEVVNGGPGVVVVVGDRVVGVLSLETSSGGVAAIRIQVNPDKLVRLTRRWTASEHGQPLLDGW